MGYDAEIVGDLVAEVFPAFGDGFSEECQYCISKLPFCGVISIVGDVLVHDFPLPLDWVQMGAIGRQVDQVDGAARAG